MQPNELTVNDALTFVLAGHAIFTIKSLLTESRFTYRVRQCEDNDRIYFVDLLTGSNNETDYMYTGFIRISDDGIPEYIRKDKDAAKIGDDAKSIVAFKHVLQRLINNKPSINLQMWHEGYCGRCGKLLTVPESIETGIGPTCARKMQKHNKDATKNKKRRSVQDNTTVVET